ncbi:VPA1269 family protein [Sinorhizobium sp. CCBAU 05631]|uniref:VPA1269 family protein n=1 Tax=Sinorhizobium sp. CCBAU 05631 TaxID=794846 RepID=UPI0004B6DA3F|nr:VPA1269 family protein [Sinorhizobium sp. CCBAU 05631]ASY58274.1 putative membrane protein [Sinorhizobium sp. CCBAU 05631]
MRTRGYAYRFEDTVPNITGFYVNTNKTGEPYQIPWEHEETHKRLWHLRQWQVRYNPIKKALSPEQYLDNPDEYPDVTKKRLPRILPIARLFPTSRRPWAGRIPTSSEIDKAWHKLMVEVERRWNLENPDNQVMIVRYQEKTGQPQGSIYNIHGMRVRGLTDLRRGGMSLDVLSKFVAGHASLMMTLYYLEFEPASVNAMISKAAVEAKATEINDFVTDFKKLSYEDARRRSVSVHPDAIAAAVESPSKIEFCNVDIGMCPFDGARCYDGGPVLRADNRSGGSFGVHGDVGSRNCIMCRHFVSGPPWIPQLELYGGKLCAKRQYLARKETEINERAALLRDQREAGLNTRAEEMTASAALQADLIAIKDEQEMNETAIFNVEMLLTASIEIMARTEEGDSESGIALVGNDRRSAVQYVEVPEFVRALMLARVAEVYPVLGDDRIIAERDRMIDLIMHNAGEVPLGLRVNITDRQRNRARDMLSKWMLGRLKAHDIAALGDGRQRLQDLRVAGEVKAMISRALSDSVPLGTGLTDSSLRSLEHSEVR